METHKLQNLLIVAVLIALVLQVALSAILLIRMNFLARMVSSVQGTVAASLSRGPRVFNTPVDNAPSIGPAEARVTVIVFSDFQCGACAEALPTIEELVKSYPDTVRLVHLDFPLSTDPTSASIQAANAARCAGEQDRYWEMHDLLFAHPDRVAAGEFLALGQEIGLDGPSFAKCVQDARYTAAVMEDQKKGLDAGVSATPTVFINGQALEGPLSDLRQIIEKQLKED